MPKFIPLLIFLLSGCAVVPSAVQTLDPIHQQAVHISSKKLTLWEMIDGNWHKVYGPMPVTLGRNGLAPEGQKKEGDGKTPSGIFDLGTSFGYFPVIHTELDYRQTDSQDFWVDDPASPDYNKWVRGTPNATSFEKLKRDDHQYALGVVIEYNTDSIIPGAGSAIFMHIWRRYNHSTAGCVALSERNLRRLLKHLKKTYQPVIILEK